MLVQSPSKVDVNAKANKLMNLQSTNPAIFGNNEVGMCADLNELNKNKEAVQQETLAMQTWNKVGGAR